jgi:hypothetical protein
MGNHAPVRVVAYTVHRLARDDRDVNTPACNNAKRTTVRVAIAMWGKLQPGGYTLTC